MREQNGQHRPPGRTVADTSLVIPAKAGIQGRAGPRPEFILGPRAARTRGPG